MKMNKKVVIFGLVTIAIVLAGVLVGATLMSSKSFDDFKESLEMKISTDKTSYSIGETVLISMKLINHGTENISLTFFSGKTSDFKVLNEQGEQVCLWSYNKVFIAVLRTITIHPGEVLSYNMTWDQKDNNGNSVPAGTYTIIGYISEYSDTVSIKIQ